jgi:hypothetical protein
MDQPLVRIHVRLPARYRLKSANLFFGDAAGFEHFQS